MAKSSVKNRIKITKTGKVRRRAMGLGHSRANKSRGQILRKKNKRDLNIPGKTIKRLT
jgi:ribosomal protein L35